MAARPLQLWRCAAPPEAAANDLPAILLYLLGELGRTPSGTFEFVRDDGALVFYRCWCDGDRLVIVYRDRLVVVWRRRGWRERRRVRGELLF